MRIKVVKAGAKGATGINGASVKLEPQTDGQRAQVTMLPAWVDAFGQDKVIARVSMSAEEARSLASRLMVAARDAEMLLQNEQTVTRR